MGTQVFVTRVQERASQRDACALQLVCRAWRVAAIRLTYERLVLCCDRHMKPLVEVLENSKKRDTKERGYGWWVREIESRRNSCPSEGDDAATCLEELKSHITNTVRILRCTVNLQIYINKNGCGKPLGLVMNKHVILSLGELCGASLRRLEWAASECPRWEDLRLLLCMTPRLRSLSLLYMIFKRRQAEAETPDLPEKPCFLRYLRELRLGPFPTPLGTSIPYWDELLTFLMPPKDHHHQPSSVPRTAPAESDLQLPMLRSLAITPLNLVAPDTPTERFFTIYGARIQQLHTASLTLKSVSASAADLTVTATATATTTTTGVGGAHDHTLHTLLALCPDLRALVFNPLQPMLPPRAHAKLERIALFPPHERTIAVPRRMCAAFIQRPVHAVLAELLFPGAFPRLHVLRLRDLGALGCLDPAVSRDWVEEWGHRLEECGIRFENRDGMRFQLTVEDSMEDMPDDV